MFAIIIGCLYLLSNIAFLCAFLNTIYDEKILIPTIVTIGLESVLTVLVMMYLVSENKRIYKCLIALTMGLLFISIAVLNVYLTSEYYSNALVIYAVSPILICFFGGLIGLGWLIYDKCYCNQSNQINQTDYQTDYQSII